MTDQANEGLLSPLLRRKRVAAVLPYLNGRVLDVGCGSGALAQFVEPGNYLGVEPDQQSLARARSDFPRHAFQSDLPGPAESFDTVVSLAVIEHVAQPESFLGELAAMLSENAAARIVCTTPHPRMDWIHDIGARLGLFSKHASDEHEALLGHARLKSTGEAAGLTLVAYRRFLFGANQLAVFQSCKPTK